MTSIIDQLADVITRRHAAQDRYFDTDNPTDAEQAKAEGQKLIEEFRALRKNATDADVWAAQQKVREAEQ